MTLPEHPCDLCDGTGHIAYKVEGIIQSWSANTTPISSGFQTTVPDRYVVTHCSLCHGTGVTSDVRAEDA